jgi:hypothetical protein
MEPQSRQFDGVGFDNGTVRLDKQGLPMKPGQDWVSPWPVGHPNREEYVSPADETRNSKLGLKPTDFKHTKTKNGLNIELSYPLTDK